MITLVIKDGRVVDYGRVGKDWPQYDESYTVVDWDGDESFLSRSSEVPPGLMPSDPRTPQQKVNDAKIQYIRKRKAAHPPTHRALMMIYRDMKNGTTEYVDAVDAIIATHPKPTP